jgi:AcrR family transcriptional regulator
MAENAVASRRLAENPRRPEIDAQMNPRAGAVQATIEAPVKAPTRRAIAKQQTRNRVLDAARELFSEQGYEGATIRDIASAAGMSTGAVFANFTDKSDLFREIMIADMLQLSDRMREAAAVAGDIEDRLVRIFDAGYAFYKRQLPLARAAFSVSWSPQDGKVLRSVPPVQLLRDLITQQLDAAIQRGELAVGSDTVLRGEMLFECYLSNYPQAIYGGWSLDALQARSRDQIRIVLAGARRS